MKFYDEIMQFKSDTKASQVTKDLLQGSTVVDISNVVSYYWEGCDKEFWGMQDFPNIAPPLNKAFFETVAPKQCVSKETGTRPWDFGMMPSVWGYRVTAEEVEPACSMIHTGEGKVHFLRTCQKTLIEMRNTVQNTNMLAYDTVKKGGADKDLDELLAPLGDIGAKMRACIHLIMNYEKILACIRDENWTEAAFLFDHVNDFKWLVDITLYQKWPILHTDITEASWVWKMFVKSNGEISTLGNTEVPYLLSAAGPGLQYMTIGLTEQGFTLGEAMTLLDKQMFPFLHNILLSFSFMHCKNVTMQTHTPERKIPHNKSAKRRGDKPMQPVTFKVLDIRPMRKVLQREGREDVEGTTYALSICRGHFKNFEEKGLFGKYKGTYWWNEQVRGSVKSGTVVKDYRLHAPTDQL